MESKSEAQGILLEYLEQMMPVMEGRPVDSEGWPFDVGSKIYKPFLRSPLITEKMTKEKLDKINKSDNTIFLVVGDSTVNYWILAPYKNGFVWVSKSKIEKMVENWRWRGNHNRDWWRNRTYTLISDYVKKTSVKQKTLTDILYEGLPPSGKTFYLLTPVLYWPSRTLNFSRGGFL
jgi:hypothetical protein